MDRVIPANAPTDIEEYRSWERMGRELDTAEIQHARVLDLLKRTKVDDLAAKTTIHVVGATWGDGSMSLTNAIQEVVRERLGELVAEAVSRLEIVVTEKRNELERSFKAPKGGAKRNGDGKEGNT